MLTTTQAKNVAMLDVLWSVPAVSRIYARSIEHGPVLLLSHSVRRPTAGSPKRSPG
ncbi:MAG: hypothetical protein R2875_01365 [Desulfobacterales bacterium]